MELMRGILGARTLPDASAIRCLSPYLGLGVTFIRTIGVLSTPGGVIVISMKKGNNKCTELHDVEMSHEKKRLMCLFPDKNYT